MLIFERSKMGRCAKAQLMDTRHDTLAIPDNFLRQSPPRLPACSELEVVRHYTRLSTLNFSIDTHFYPLGSCTMKYNPRGVHKAASLDGFLNRHPLAPIELSQGYLGVCYALQGYLSEITGLPGVSLTPMAGSQGELAGVAMIKAYHQSRGDNARDEMLIPDAAHGTNPASAVMCGFKVVELKTNDDGELDLELLRSSVGSKTAGIMLTNPSTLGVFMSQIKTVAEIIHEAGGLLYYDGANLNAILGHTRPGDMGFDVVHLNLHKTFATPHGGGGPGAGPVTVSPRLIPFLPIPYVINENGVYRYTTRQDCPATIGRLSTFMGNAGILLRAYLYIRILGAKGLKQVAQCATLNANYLLKRLTDAGFNAAIPNRRATHEFIITLKEMKKETGLTAMDFAKRLLDYGIHAPTTYFPLLVPECLLIEPTETESKETLDRFIEAMVSVLNEANNEPMLLKNAPHHLPVRRLDDVKAARELDLNYYYTHRVAVV